MAEYIDREEFLKRIKPYNTSDKTDKALYNFALNKMMGTPNANVIPVPEDATNGDMIMAMFNDFESALLLQVISKDWWNAPYKTESEE